MKKRFELLKAKLMALGIDIEGLPDGKTYQDILALIGNGPLSKVKKFVSCSQYEKKQNMILMLKLVILHLH